MTPAASAAALRCRAGLYASLCIHERICQIPKHIPQALQPTGLFSPRCRLHTLCFESCKLYMLPSGLSQLQRLTSLVANNNPSGVRTLSTTLLNMPAAQRFGIDELSFQLHDMRTCMQLTLSTIWLQLCMYIEVGALAGPVLQHVELWAAPFTTLLAPQSPMPVASASLRDLDVIAELGPKWQLQELPALTRLHLTNVNSTPPSLTALTALRVRVFRWLPVSSSDDNIQISTPDHSDSPA